MSENNATVSTQENGENQNRTFTQEEVNAIVGKRLAEEKGKYSDYEDLKAKAAKYDEAEEALSSVKKAGFPSAFIIAFDDRQSVALSKARKKESSVKVITEEVRIVK